jgi:hypothetical protein
MAKVHSRQIPYLALRPYDDGSGWYVEAKWVARATEQLGRFDTYSEARDWMALESTAYFVLRELGQWSSAANAPAPGANLAAESKAESISSAVEPI